MATAPKRKAAPKRATPGAAAAARLTPLREARDPTTPPARLLELGRKGAMSVRSAVARNPNTPVEALRELVDYYHRDVQANPGWMLAVLADPSLQTLLDAQIARISYRTEELLDLSHSSSLEVLESVARNRRTPAEAFARLACHPSLFSAIASNPSAPADVLASLAPGADSSVSNALLGHPATPAEVLRSLLERAPTWQRKFALEQLLRNPSAPGDLVALAAALDGLRLKAASHAKAPPELLRAMVQDDDPRVRQEAALHPSLPAELLDELAHHRSSAMRLCAAQNPACSTGTLSVLANDADAKVRQAVAIHRNTPLHLRQRLGGLG